MRISKIGIVLVFTARSVLAAQGQLALHARADENILHALVRVAHAGSLPLGIVQPNDGALCRTVTVGIPEHPPNTEEAVRILAKQAGYEVAQSDGVWVVRPHIVQGKLATWMNYRLEGFGEQTIPCDPWAAF